MQNGLSFTQWWEAGCWCKWCAGPSALICYQQIWSRAERCHIRLITHWALDRSAAFSIFFLDCGWGACLWQVKCVWDKSESTGVNSHWRTSVSSSATILPECLSVIHRRLLDFCQSTIFTVSVSVCLKIVWSGCILQNNGIRFALFEPVFICFN